MSTTPDTATFPLCPMHRKWECLLTFRQYMAWNGLLCVLLVPVQKCSWQSLMRRSPCLQREKWQEDLDQRCDNDAHKRRTVQESERMLVQMICVLTQWWWLQKAGVFQEESQSREVGGWRTLNVQARRSKAESCLATACTPKDRPDRT
jgi:hypothetical protein